MGIKESIANLRKALRTTQTNAPAVIDTLIRSLDGVETAAEEENTYSTDERIVGTWIDGSDIYEKVIEFGALPNATNKRVEHGITGINKIISITGTASDENYSTTVTIPDHSPAISIFVSSTNIVITTITDQTSNINTFITLRYTKSAASRSPENDTKNEGNEEKNTDER